MMAFSILLNFLHQQNSIVSWYFGFTTLLFYEISVLSLFIKMRWERFISINIKLSQLTGDLYVA